MPPLPPKRRRRTTTAAVPLGLGCLLLCPAATAQAPPYRDPALRLEQRVADLLGRMTLQEKFWQLYMSPGDLDRPDSTLAHGMFGLQIGLAPGEPPAGTLPGEIARRHAIRINAIQRHFVEDTRLGIPIIPFDEALHGLMRAGATAFPQAIGLAATWDTALMGRVSRAAALETRSRGVRQALSPVVNIADDVRWGRVEETYGEDPYLAGVMGRSFVEAFERAGVITTPKHFVANVGQGGRDSYPIDHSERLLDELYFPPFRDAVSAGARSLMTAYNSVDGVPATQNRRLLTDKLRREWGFSGFVISDAAATGGATVLHFTEPNTPTAAKHAWEAGLDVVFQSTVAQHRPYWEAVRQGLIAEALLDSAVARVLGAKFQLGLFERPYVNPDTAALWNGRAEHLALARDAARASLVLLRNEAGALPLDAGRGPIAVIGADAAEPRLGGYSGPGIAPVSILAGIRAAAGAGTEVRYARGPGRDPVGPEIIPSAHLRHEAAGARREGLLGEYFPNTGLEGEPAMVRTDPRVDFRWTLSSPGRGIPFDWYSVRWTGSLTAPLVGVRRLGVEGNDGYRLWLDGRLAIDNWRKQGFGRRMVDVTLEPGRDYDLRLEFFESTGVARVRLVWETQAATGPQPAIDSAAAAASGAAAAVVVVGVEEGEFRDRALLRLPGHQEALIDAVVATGTPTVVVVVGGSAVTMSPWLDEVDGVLMAWYPGEQGGHAVADALFGAYNPAGRLPITFPVAEGQLPLTYHHKPTGRGDDYVDLTGMPLFPFGFGLSYTRFEYSDLRIDPPQIADTGSGAVSFTVRNAGDRPGDEVVQLYLRDLLATVARPVQQLRGFRRIRLAPGEAAPVSFRLGAEDLRLLDRHGRWVVEPGRFRIMVGASSEDIRLRGFLEVR